MIDARSADALVDAVISASPASSAPQQVGGVVQGRDADGTIWVLLDGATEPTPARSTTVAVSPGDVVTATIGGGRVAIDGNRSRPATDDARAIEAKEAAKDAMEAATAAAAEATRAMVGIESAEADAAAAMSASSAARIAADQAESIAKATGQHFWHNDSDASTHGGAGVHVTDQTQEDWDAAVAAGFPDLSSAKPYHNVLINSLGMLLRTAVSNLVSITRSAIAFFDGLGNDAGNITASFGANGAQIGKTSGKHVELTSSGLSVKDGSVAMANFGPTEIGLGRNALEIATVPAPTVLVPSSTTIVSYDTTTGTWKTIQATPGQAIDANGVSAVFSVEDIPGWPGTSYIAFVNDVDMQSNAFIGSDLYVTGDSSIGGTLKLTRTQDASGTADNQPALMIGAESGQHLEFDGNEIMSKASATSTGTLYINNDGGLVAVGSGGIRTTGKYAARHTGVTAGTAPSAQTYKQVTEVQDSNGDIVGHDEYTFYIDKSIGHNFAAVRQKVGDTFYWYQSYMKVDSTGTVTYSIHTPAAFRSAIGAAASSHTHSYLPLSGGEMTGGLTFKDTTAIPSATGTGWFPIVMNSFANGGQLHYMSVANFRTNINAVNKSGDTMTGNLDLKDSNMDRDGANPSSTVNGLYQRFIDNDGERLTMQRVYRTTAGQIQYFIGAYNEKSDGTEVTHGVTFQVSKDGTRAISVNDAAAWRSGLGITPANIGAAPDTIAKSNATSQITAASGFTVSVCETALFAGSVVSVRLAIKTTNAMTANTNYTVGTLKAGMRPYQTMYLNSSHTEDEGAWWINSSGVITYRPGANRSAGTTHYASGTWVVAS